MESLLKNKIILLLLVFFTRLSAQPDENLFRVLKKHNDAINMVAFSDDGKYLASGGEDKAIYIWDFSTGEAVFSNTGNYFPVKSLKFLGQEILATSGTDIKIVDFEGNLKNAFKGYTTHIWSFDYCQSTGTLVAGSYSKKVHIWDMNSAAIKSTLEGHDKSVLAACISPDGKYVATGSLDQSVRLWDAASGTELRKLERHSDNILVVKFHPSGRYFASGSLDKTVRLWDADSGRVVKSYIGHEKGIMDLDFSADGYYLATASADNTIVLWEVYTGNKLYSFVDHGGSVNTVKFSPDGGFLVSGSSDKSVMIWKLNKSIYCNFYFQDEIDDEISQSDLFGPKRKDENKQQYEERQQQAGQTLEDLYDRYYQEYLKIKHRQIIAD
ncbi:MAG: WD40 repeat domain-containing protein [Bacteroidales bacterium]|nr:WD40 repeat domain-containing protein [Bacteroidales bacterium]